MVFSNRRIVRAQSDVYSENVTFVVYKMSLLWRGAMRIGFTGTDPAMFNRTRLGECDYPFDSNTVWQRPLLELQAWPKTHVVFNYDYKGVIRYGLNGSVLSEIDRMSTVDTDLWAVMNLYGQTYGIQLTDHHVPAEVGTFASIVEDKIN